MFERRKISNPWEGRIEPFKIIGNVYFVGTFQASCHLVDTGDGLILIDPGYSNTLYLIIDGISKLGFKPSDIKYIVNTHWHSDHTEACAALAELSGAKTLIGIRDFEKAKKYFEADIKIKDGDTLELGNVKMEFLETPGHTEGTVSFFFNTVDEGKTYRVGMFGGAGLNTLHPENYEYEGCVKDYFNSVARLKKEKVDVFIGNHVGNNDTEVKAEHLRKTGENLFIDSDIWYSFLDRCENNLKKLVLESQQK